MDNTITVTTIIKRLAAVCLMLLLLAGTLPAASQDSMIPDDFDWSTYMEYWGYWDDDFGLSQQPDYSYQYQYQYQDPFTYTWNGDTYTITFGEPTPVPQQYDYGVQSYEASTTPYQYYDYNDGASAAVTQYNTDDDGWFYQLEPGFYDDFSTFGLGQNIPESAFVSGFTGYEQSYNLDCEARSAVDLAAWFGVDINHSEFLYYLPKSDDPNEGFVGSWTDARGNIPPASYGVYQEPVAALLRNYGLNAVGAYAYTEDALKSQIAQGKPVMVWVVGNVELGYSKPYTAASTGRTTYVVPYQHTVVVTGYDANSVYVQDGGLKYTRDWNTFLLSWGALGNRAIYVN